MEGWWRWALVSPDGVAPSRMIGVLPLLIFPCTIKSRSSLLAPAHPGGPGKRAVKRLCVLVSFMLFFLGVIRKYVLAFSVRVNGTRILSVDSPPADGSTLPALHGVRFLSMSWVILGHTYVIGLSTISKLTFSSTDI